MNSNWVIGLLVVAFVGTGAYMLFTRSTPQQPVKATPGADRFNICERMQGMTWCYFRVDFTASTTPASIQNPLSSTSTVQQYTCRQTSLAGGAAQWEAGVQYTRFASTTGGVVPGEYIFMGKREITTLANNVMTAASSSMPIGPRQWIVLKNATSSLGTNSPAGVCTAVIAGDSN